LRLRRRLLVFSAPVAVLMVVAILKSASVVIAGGSAATDFAHRDNGALRGDVAVLSLLNVVEPAKAYFAAGDLAVLDGRLEDADVQFATALDRTDPAATCPVRINLELVRETLGDRAAGVLDGNAAVTRYRDALAMVDGAPAGCFDADTTARLHDKIDAAMVAPPPPPPPVAAPPPPPPPPASGGSAPDESDRQLRLDPGSGDPLDRLQQILRDAAG
jgi:hypothetical protein